MARNFVDITEDAYDEFAQAVFKDEFKFDKMFTYIAMNGNTKVWQVMERTGGF